MNDFARTIAKRTLRDARSERGFSLVELMLAMALTSVGVAATLGVFGSSGRTTLAAQRGEVATQQAQAELDELANLGYNQLALTSAPQSSTDPNDPGYRVSGNTLRVKPGVTEPYVTGSDADQDPKVDPGPTSFGVGTGGSAVGGKIYRYVTWRDENCPTSLCDGTQNTKRVTVAVTLDVTASIPVRPPLWVSTIVVDPDAAPPGTATTPSTPAGEDVDAQPFFLYDTRCGQTQRQSQSGSHATHNTASSGSAASQYSVCENTDTSKQPDLMGSTPAPGSNSTPLYEYSSDLAGAYDGGLAMMR